MSSAELVRQVHEQRSLGREIVVVQGLGFVGCAVAAVVAGARDGGGRPRYFVIGVDLPTPTGRRKVELLNSGRCAVDADDPELMKLIHGAACEAGNLRCVVDEAAYALADIIIIDLPLDVYNRAAVEPREIKVGIDSFLQSACAVARYMPADTLVLVESTMPIGTCERLLVPALREERKRRGITSPLRLAHCFERVMPGAGYVDSIRRNWRAFAGVDEESSVRARRFLSTFTDVQTHPLTELSDTNSSEFAKLLENSYRAANIAFIYEWTLLAETMGIDLFAVIDAIRVRKGTHDNIRLPGFGVGGYCLTKDSYLAQWSATQLWGADVTLAITMNALRTNHFMPLHTVDLLTELLGGTLAGRKVAVLGVSYLREVADTRNSPTELLVDELLKRNAVVVAHDPCVRQWPERPEVPLVSDLSLCLAKAEGMVLAVAHRAYQALAAAALVPLLEKGAVVVDAQNVISDPKAEAFHREGYRLAGVGKGHWRKRGYDRSE